MNFFSAIYWLGESGKNAYIVERSKHPRFRSASKFELLHILTSLQNVDAMNGRHFEKTENRIRTPIQLRNMQLHGIWENTKAQVLEIKESE